MLPEHEQRFERIASEFLERPAGDYAELLRRGHVSSPDGVDPEEWRDEIRRNARQDRIRVITSRVGHGAVAMLNRKIPDDRAMDAMRAALDRTTALGELEERSVELGHELSRWLGPSRRIDRVLRPLWRADLRATRSAEHPGRRGANRSAARARPTELGIQILLSDQHRSISQGAAAPPDCGSATIDRRRCSPAHMQQRRREWWISIGAAVCATHFTAAGLPHFRETRSELPGRPTLVSCFVVVRSTPRWLWRRCPESARLASAGDSEKLVRERVFEPGLEGVRGPASVVHEFAVDLGEGERGDDRCGVFWGESVGERGL